MASLGIGGLGLGQGAMAGFTSPHLIPSPSRLVSCPLISSCPRRHEGDARANPAALVRAGEKSRGVGRATWAKERADEAAREAGTAAGAGARAATAAGAGASRRRNHGRAEERGGGRPGSDGRGGGRRPRGRADKAAREAGTAAGVRAPAQEDGAERGDEPRRFGVEQKLGGGGARNAPVVEQKAVRLFCSNTVPPPGRCRARGP